MERLFIMYDLVWKGRVRIMQKQSVMAVINLTEEEKKEMLKEIEYFFTEVREEKIGIIGCEQTLDFFLETLGKQIYNKALDDTHKWYRRMSDNLESDFYSLYK